MAMLHCLTAQHRPLCCNEAAYGHLHFYSVVIAVLTALLLHRKLLVQLLVLMVPQ